MTAKDHETEPFWRVKTLDEMSVAEWESLCDGCGRCCLVKLEDDDTGEIHFTDIGCRLLDGKTCRCLDYPRRHRLVPDCVKLTPDAVRELTGFPSPAPIGWSPKDGTYSWHPLVSGSPDSVHEAGVLVRGGVGERERPCPRTLAAPDRQMAEPQAARPALSRLSLVSKPPRARDLRQRNRPSIGHPAGLSKVAFGSAA